jgi:hypothetical protein
MQFTVWRYSAKSRAIIETINTIIIAAIAHYFLREVLLMSPEIVTRVTKIIELEKEYSSLAGDFKQAKYDEI